MRKSSVFSGDRVKCRTVFSLLFIHQMLVDILHNCRVQRLTGGTTSLGKGQKGHLKEMGRKHYVTTSVRLFSKSPTEIGVKK